ncbi:hypothetical protein OROMI_017139 [Orobanche minor]
MSSVIGDDWDEEMMVMRPIFVPKSGRVTIGEESTRIQVEGWKREAEKKIMEIEIQRDDDVNEGKRERERDRVGREAILMLKKKEKRKLRLMHRYYPDSSTPLCRWTYDESLQTKYKEKKKSQSEDTLMDEKEKE